ncbi:MAG: 50S ribosomal protein L11 methyltransferase [Bacteroidia bacterium]
MKVNYIETSISAPEVLREQVLALLANIGYSAFEDTESGINAYIEEPEFDQETFDHTLALFEGQGVTYVHQSIKSQNWNEQWENSYPSVMIDNFCQIIPSFRKPEPDFAYTITIDPKMSFGTGHHETTRLMIRLMKNMDMQGKTVLDMGCGTGVLGILGSQMGAQSVTGIDIDHWSYENARENVSINKTENIEIILGDSSVIPDQKFDIILANINRNVLLEDLPIYATRLKNGGLLAMSGYYLQDQKLLIQAAKPLNLELVSSEEDNQWLAMTFKQMS